MMVDVHRSKMLIQQNMKLSFLENALPEIREDTTYTIVTQKVVNPYSFILVALKTSPIENLYIATYSINLKAVEIICSLLDEGLIKNFVLILNCNMKFKMKGKEVALMAEAEKRDNFTILKKYSHAKVTLIEQTARYIVISGSGNYSENPKIEQYTVNNSRELFDFHRRWMIA